MTILTLCRRCSVYAVVALIIALLPCLHPASASAQAKPARPLEWQMTPLIDSVVSPPRWFFGADGHFHLVYELLLANAMTLPATVSAVTVLDGDSGASLAQLAGPSFRPSRARRGRRYRRRGS
jgi:hypothetical protein